MICPCGTIFSETYHRDFHDLCPECAKVEIKDFNVMWWSWYSQLSTEQKFTYYDNAPYTLDEVREIIMKPI